MRKKFPPGYDMPVTLLGRLAIDKTLAGQGYGGELLMNALIKAYLTSYTIASTAIVTDPIDAQAKSFYEHYGFIELPDSKRMVLPFSTLEKVFKDSKNKLIKEVEKQVLFYEALGQKITD